MHLLQTWISSSVLRLQAVHAHSLALENVQKSNQDDTLLQEVSPDILCGSLLVFSALVCFQDS